MSEASIKLGVNQVAKLFGVTSRTIRRWARAGYLPSQRIGPAGHTRFDAATIRKMAQSGHTGQTTS